MVLEVLAPLPCAVHKDFKSLRVSFVSPPSAVSVVKYTTTGPQIYQQSRPTGAVNYAGSSMLERFVLMSATDALNIKLSTMPTVLPSYSYVCSSKHVPRPCRLSLRSSSAVFSPIEMSSVIACCLRDAPCLPSFLSDNSIMQDHRLSVVLDIRAA